jgi:hypothetical protein
MGDMRNGLVEETEPLVACFQNYIDYRIVTDNEKMNKVNQPIFIPLAIHITISYDGISERISYVAFSI